MLYIHLAMATEPPTLLSHSFHASFSSLKVLPLFFFFFFQYPPSSWIAPCVGTTGGGTDTTHLPCPALQLQGWCDLGSNVSYNAKPLIIVYFCKSSLSICLFHTRYIPHVLKAFYTQSKSGETIMVFTISVIIQNINQILTSMQKFFITTTGNKIRV